MIPIRPSTFCILDEFTTRKMNSMLTRKFRFYLGKKVAYVYRGQKEIRGTKIRVIWGKVTRPHGKFFPLSLKHRSLSILLRSKNRALTFFEPQATLASSVPSSLPLSPPSLSVLRFVSCCTLRRYKKGLLHRDGVSSEGGFHFGCIWARQG